MLSYEKDGVPARNSPYSPDFNPIEKTFGGFKHRQCVRFLIQMTIKSRILEIWLALFDEGVHAFLLVVRGKARVE